VDGGWPGSCHEQELVALAGLEGVLDDAEVAGLLDRGVRGLATAREHWHAPVGDRRTKDRRTNGQRASNREQAGRVRWWSRRSPSWANAWCCAAGAGCGTGP
jgi:hypothetical protein